MSNTDIIKVTQYIKYYIDNYSIIENEHINLFEELCLHIAYVLQEWSGNTYVGIEKEKVKKNIFQNFFILLNDLINYLTKNKTSSLENEFLKSIKYNGKLYRYFLSCFVNIFSILCFNFYDISVIFNLNLSSNTFFLAIYSFVLKPLTSIISCVPSL